MKIEFKDLNDLAGELQRLNSVRFDAVEKKQLTQMLNRARAQGGTPHDSGELRKSSAISSDEMGYSKDYAPHVEYGHRLVRNGRQIGYVTGQRFLLKNFQTQQPIFYEDMLKAIAKE